MRDKIDFIHLQEASFKEFLSRPENRPLVEQHQRKEVKQALQLQEKAAALKFKSKVLEADYEAQMAIAPFLKNKTLRRIIQTFSNDPQGDFEKWATNPRVLNMLQEAQKAIDEGRLNEADAEEFMLRMLRDPSHEHHQEFAMKSKQVARLPTDQLVVALNEHLTERRQGNNEYKAGNFAAALYHYERARSIVELVKGLSRVDQAEVDVNRVAVECNIAAVHLSTQDYGAAKAAASRALTIDPYCLKALSRRVKACIGRHEYGEDVEKDLKLLKSLGSEGFSEATSLQAAMKKAIAADRKTEERAFACMFDK